MKKNIRETVWPQIVDALTKDAVPEEQDIRSSVSRGNKLISLNATAAFLWKALVGKEFTAEEMAQLLVDEYGIDMELALTDSRNLMQSWTEAGIAE